MRTYFGGLVLVMLSPGGENQLANEVIQRKAELRTGESNAKVK